MHLCYLLLLTLIALVSYILNFIKFIFIYAFINLGIGNNVLISNLEEKLFSLIDDAESRAVLFNNARGIVDGHGLARCLTLIENEIEE